MPRQMVYYLPILFRLWGHLVSDLGPQGQSSQPLNQVEERSDVLRPDGISAQRAPTQ